MKWIEGLFCYFLGHSWIGEGGRPCPKGWGDCSQGAYKCERCDCYDYGYKGGPAYKECFEDCDREKEKCDECAAEDAGLCHLCDGGALFLEKELKFNPAEYEKSQTMDD